MGVCVTCNAFITPDATYRRRQKIIERVTHTGRLVWGRTEPVLARRLWQVKYALPSSTAHSAVTNLHAQRISGAVLLSLTKPRIMVRPPAAISPPVELWCFELGELLQQLWLLPPPVAGRVILASVPALALNGPVPFLGRSNPSMSSPHRSCVLARDSRVQSSARCHKR